ncbi:hypothetical protein PYCCODRAFT_321793 [Trametes coccinea BRFM310]|uniref:SET domain-containing protein n=1 Tax=Trametes coccinea (strain BRFM310) TaxID=1353009 RepID=A0A1Y2INA1_TRAC3|nr:hypothetical protein PYCCODRAFT_321793 [Trametes coccinea BRFM310]
MQMQHLLTPKCSCFRDDHECNPEHCAKQSKRGMSTKQKHCCSNMHSHLGHVPRLAVKIGSWGLGTFAQSKIKTGTFLGEYGAELIPLPTNLDEQNHLDTIQGIVHRYRGLNYLFSVNEAIHVLDAATVGDFTRRDQNSLLCIPKN